MSGPVTMSGAEQAAWWTGLAVGMVGMAISYGIETGLYCLNRVKLEVRAARGPGAGQARRLANEMERPEELLATSLICIITFGDLAATAAARLLSGHGYSEGVVIAINAAVLTPVFFVFLESIPKEIFRLEADRLTHRFAGALWAARKLLTVIPVLPLMRWTAGIVGRFLGGGEESALALSAQERVAALIRETAGAVSETQATLVDRAVIFQRMIAGEVMRPWQQVRTVPADWSREQLLRLLARDRVDIVVAVERGGEARGVVGALRFEDAFVRVGTTVANMVHRPARVPARMHLPEAAGELRDAEIDAGIVEVDGRPVGLILMADVLEPLLG